MTKQPAKHCEIVERVARMIDTEGAFALENWSSSQAPTELLKTRCEYFKARAYATAVEVLKAALELGEDHLRRQLIQDELDGWSSLGIPLDTPELRKLVEAKYGQK